MVKSEYKAIKLYSMNADELNEWFDNGWEYVHGFSQTISETGTYQRDSRGDIMIILRKPEKVML
jgi:hypothetical protein